MQPNSITLAVDELNNATTVDHVYTRHDESTNRTVYVHSGHTPLVKDTLSLYRTPSKPNGNFAGVLKTAVKFSQDIEVEGVDTSTTLYAPLILGVQFSIPLGVTNAEMLIARQRAVALLDRDDLMVDLNALQEI